MSTENIFDNSSPVIVINQATLLFKINKQNLISGNNNNNNKNVLIPVSQTEIFVTNITSNYVAYRSRITRKKYYTVEPSHFVIPPNSNIKVKITYYFSPREKFPPEGHKFRFEGVIIPNHLKNNDPKEIFDNYIANQNRIKGNSIKKIVEFIMDNNYNFSSSEEDIKLDLSQSLSSSSNFNPTASVYSNALGRSSVERPSRISLKSKKQENRLRSKKEFGEEETLDPDRLKEQCDRLQKEYDNNVRQLNEIKNKINSLGAKNKYRYIVPDVNFSTVNKKMIAIIFGMAFFLGFYLTK